MTIKKNRKIKIIGAGLSGLSAGITLSQNGYDVEIYEKNADVGGRFHGDFQGLENWSEKKDVIDDLKGMNIETEFNYYPQSEFYVSDGLKIQKVISSKPSFYLVKRGVDDDSFDQALKSQALNSGVAIVFNKTIPSAEADIIATGPLMDKICAVASGIVFNTSASDIIMLVFDQKAAPKGYGYLIIQNGSGCLVTVLFDEFKRASICFKEAKRLFSNLTDFNIENPRIMGGVGGFSVHNIFQKDNVLYVGEAAGLQDKLWGFGMRSAIRSGYLAAQSIIHNQSYEKLARKEFNKKLKASLVNRYIWEKRIVNKYEVTEKIIEAPFDKLYSFHNFNFMQKIIYPFLKKS
jgi:flavin-dependent dehydrogenase